MAIRCIALDMDKTTLDKKGRLSWGNEQALLSLIRKGIHVVIASGRPYACLPKDVMAVPGIEYAITSNGAAVYHIPSRKKLHGYDISPEAIRQLLAVLHEEGLLEADRVIIEMVIGGNAYSDQRYVEDPLRFGASLHALPYIQSTREGIADPEGFLVEHIHEMESIDLVIKEADLKRHLLDRIQTEIPDVYCTYSVPELIEISHKDAGKHRGVAFIMDYLGLSREEVAAFGDADNDIEMLSFVGTGIAMENAEDSCKNAARYITKSHEEDGVAYAISTYLHLQEEGRRKPAVHLYISSVTGNTKKVAQGVELYLKTAGYDVACHDSRDLAAAWKDREAQDPFEKDALHIICFWCRRSFLDYDSLFLLEHMEKKKIALIGTLGYYPDSSYGDLLKEKAAEAVAEKNEYLGIYLSQGKIAEERTERRRALPATSPHHLSEEGYARHLESRKHPNKEDIYGAIRFVKNLLEEK